MIHGTLVTTTTFEGARSHPIVTKHSRGYYCM